MKTKAVTAQNESMTHRLMAKEKEVEMQIRSKLAAMRHARASKPISSRGGGPMADLGDDYGI